jgi:erythromycin esterase-like protein
LPRSLHSSAAAVIDYLEAHDPAAANEARARYACLDRWALPAAVGGA